ncbi:hypothetical protein LX32DRAFT_195876 [Colletotrichum zoysiae]|uniref:Uncharacterized protein n=1 Tax=Colletotrichum zoysiae TaxID=1216348 RepID=A0AAD9HNH5_9PEZI|nr:hypothetical protein LX32DRAFT_195876 [Colletotrichum zoysiae]
MKREENLPSARLSSDTLIGPALPVLVCPANNNAFLGCKVAATNAAVFDTMPPNSSLSFFSSRQTPTPPIFRSLWPELLLLSFQVRPATTLLSPSPPFLSCALLSLSLSRCRWAISSTVGGGQFLAGNNSFGSVKVMLDRDSTVRKKLHVLRQPSGRWRGRGMVAAANRRRVI